MYRVAMDINGLASISDDSRIAKIVDNAVICVDLQMNKITHNALNLEVESITTSNPLYQVFMSLPLITLHDLKTREPLLFL